MTDPTAVRSDPDEATERKRRFSDWRLWVALAVTLLMVCVTVAFVSVVLDRGSTRKQLDSTLTQLDTTNGELRDTRRDLAAAKTALATSDRAANCRTRLANNVSDAQADAIIAIGNLALMLYVGDGPGAQAASKKYLVASAAYRDAVNDRGDSVAKCKGS